MAAFYTVALALCFGVLSHVLGKILRIPAIIFFLAFGVLSGQMGLHLINTAHLGNGLIVLVEIVVALILFEGGLSLSGHIFQSEKAALHRLLVGTLAITGIGATLLAKYFLNVSWAYSALFGSVIIVTGPTVMGSILRNVSLLPRLEALLHWESIWGDVAGVMVSAVALELLTHPKSETEGIGLALELVLRIFAGIGIGLSWGWLLKTWIFPLLQRLSDETLPAIVAIASAIFAFAAPNLIFEGSGPLASVVTGLTLTRLPREQLRRILSFKEQIGSILIATIFVLLSAEVDLRPLKSQWMSMFLVALILGAVVRPIAVYGALLGSTIPMKEQTYIAFVGPRGILAIASVAYASLHLGHSPKEIEILKATIFGIILMSGSIATFICKPLARLLKVDAPPEKTGVLIVGLNEITLAIAKFINPYVPLAFADTRPTICWRASTEGFETLCSNVISGSLYEEARKVGYGRLVIATPDEALNELVAMKASPYFGPNRIFKARGHIDEDFIFMEPFSNSMPLFHERFTVPDILKALQSGRAKFLEIDIVDPISSEEEGTIFPIVEITMENRGVRFITPSAKPSGKTLSLCVNQI
ncbi:MAG: sodium:proton antiporter [Deltaproteobacteria bacterium]|nr:sodium:proton antiporter [Deltaproteobacteria bacterium]MBW2068851.1 sodium:proton antiporter [Deltaproteobacteria bacterium]